MSFKDITMQNIQQLSTQLIHLVGHTIENTSWTKLAFGVWAASIGVATTYVLATAFKPSSPITVQQIEADGGNALVLRDKRVLEYFIHGDPTSHTVLLAIHGAQTTGKLFTLLHPWAQNAKVRSLHQHFLVSALLHSVMITHWKIGFR